MIPLAALLPGRDYKDTADGSMTCWRTRRDVTDPRPGRRPARTAVYLPNRGEHYEHLTRREGARLDLTDHPILARREETRRKRAEAEAAAQGAPGAEAARARIPHRRSPVADREVQRRTTRSRSCEERHGYKRAGSSNDWRSPYQSSGSYAMGDYGDHWISLSGSDAANGVGRLTAGGDCHGDAFDLFVHFEHGGDFEKAVDFSP